VKAVILAGGEGRRLRPLTSNAPKPMLPVANIPMMQHVLHLLRRHGFDDVIVTVAFLANAIKNEFGDGSDYGVRISYAEEAVPLGTAGSVGNAKERLNERFLVISGDVITDVDLTKLVARHDDRGAMATIGLVQVDNPLEFAIVITRDDGTIERFLEKPSWGQVFSDTINTGIYVLEPSVFDYIPPGCSVDFASDVFPHMLAAGQPLHGTIAEGYWEDVGTHEAYLGAHKDVLDRRLRIDIPGFRVSERVWLGEAADVSPDAEVVGPAVIGPGCKIGPGCRIGEYVVLGSNVRVLAGADLERSVVHDNAYIGPGARLRGTIVGRASNLRANARCEEGVVLGDDVSVGSNAVITNNVKVYPSKTIDDGAIVNASIIWESRGARSLFDRTGVSGLANVDMTPELAAKLAMAYGTSLAKGTTVVTSRDSSRSARMFKRATMAGLNSAGVNVLDLEVASMPVTRFLVRSPRAFGGLSVRLRLDDPDSVIVRFFDNTGADISDDAKRKIERLLQREDYRRVLPEEIGDITFPPQALEDYTVALEGTVDIGAIRNRKFKLVVDHGYGATSLVMPNVLAKLGADVLSVNPFASTSGLMRFDRDEACARVSSLVVASGAHLGAVLDPDGERLFLIDDEGAALDDKESLMAFVDLVCGHLLGDRIALPVTATAHARHLAARHGVSIRETKMASAALADAATEPGVGFAADGEGGFILPGFLPAFDAAAALVKMLDLLAREGRELSSVRRQMPRVHLAQANVPTPWDQKGLVMRSLVEQADGDLILVDGVKSLHAHGWALALPDPDAAITRVWAEADSDSAAKRLVRQYVQRIRQLIR
jgi:mannose-1-phosphate guanylyltransferase / phosphomannomutase